MSATEPGLLIAFCGLDGSGKTTQLRLLAETLAARGREVVTTKQPTDWYRTDPVVRAYLDHGTGRGTPGFEPELALFAAADRLRHLRTEIVPALDRGAVVLTDRYVYSSYAYFASRGMADDVPWLVSLNRHARVPDATIYLDIPPRLAVARVARRDGAAAKFEERNVQLLDAVRQTFLSQPWGPTPGFHVIDAQLEAELIHLDVVSIVDNALRQAGANAVATR